MQRILSYGQFNDMTDGVRRLLCFVMAVLTLGFSFTASAAGVLRDDKTDQEWEIIVAPYLWATSLNGTATAGALPPLDIDVSFSDIMDHLDIAFAMHTEFHRGKWALVIDPTYLSITLDVDTPVAGVKPRIEADIWIVEAFGTYKVTPHWELLAGARWQDHDLSVSRLPSPPLPVTGGGVRDNWLDWIAGARFNAAFNEKWSVTSRADVAFAGDSDSSYNLNFFLNRRFGKNMALRFGYRYFEDDNDNSPKYEWDIVQEGPLIGYSWSL